MAFTTKPNALVDGDDHVVPVATTTTDLFAGSTPDRPRLALGTTTLAACGSGGAKRYQTQVAKTPRKDSDCGKRNAHVNTGVGQKYNTFEPASEETSVSGHTHFGDVQGFSEVGRPQAG
jgi:hypothetical protein